MYAVIGRAVLSKAPSILRGIGSLFNKKLTIGSAAAMAAAPTALSFLDNQTGNKLSKALIESPMGEAVEKVLSVNEWSNDQKSAVISNTITDQLEKRGKLDPNSEDYATQKQMADALGHIIIGDQIGAANAAANLGVNPSDLMASYNDARRQNPNGSMGDVSAQAFENLQQRIERNRAAQQDADLVRTQNAQTQQGTHTPSSSQSRPQGTQIDLNQQISSAFEQAADNAGWTGSLMKGISFVIGIFNDNAQTQFQKFALSMMGVEEKFDRLQDGIRNNRVTSALGNQFGLGTAPSLAPQYAYD